MAVYSTSRYKGGLVVPVECTRNGITKERPFLYTRPPIGNVTITRIYTTQDGDRLDLLAFRFAKDSTLWWVIAEVNKIFGFPLFLTPGTPLLIPSYADFQRLGGA